MNLIKVPAVHFSLTDGGSDGIYITPKVCKSNAEIYVNCIMDGLYHKSDEFTIMLSMKDREETELCFVEQSVENKTAKLIIDHPVLWDGINNPYLYTLKAILLYNGKPIDELTITFGVRNYCIDREKGFFLNSKYKKLYGVARHQDRKGKGFSISYGDQKEDMELIKEIGANAIRLAHYQHDRYFYDLCDREGMIVWAEIPFISLMSKSQKARDNAIQMLTELVKQNYNHPSIFLWGIQNEIEIKWRGQPIIDMVKELAELVHKLDSTRLSVGANEFGVLMDSPLNWMTDVIGYNHYFGWYRGKAEDLGTWCDEYDKHNKGSSLCISEYGAEGLTHIHSNQPVIGDYSEEYQAIFHEISWNIIKKRKFIWGSFIWNMFDFASEIRREGGTRGVNNKGLVSYDRKIKKDSFYFYQAQWSQKPMVYIAGKRFEVRTEDFIFIKVYSNCPRVRLYVDNAFMKEQKVMDGICIFEKIPLKYKEIEIKTEGLMEETIVADSAVFIKRMEPHKDYERYSKKSENITTNWF